ncbi:hypothetical protein BJY04DRAFT_215445 [Aspergillus karnatakaensis]|uniref:uncharacterized protein n=1 Tax=Aspergillus karnatakaensis TaxID=1810916 RepID=UPI003CCD8F52
MPSLNVDVESFYRLNDIYMLGSSFATAFHRALEYCYRHSPCIFEEGFAALGSMLSYARFGQLTKEQVNVHSGAVSLEKLRNAVISNMHDALAIVMLGQALAAFDSLLTSKSSNLIIRHSLLLARPWYAEIVQHSFLEPIAISPLLWDTVWCLLHREVPMIRPVLNRTGVVDRSAGLCTSLLSILYDLCVVSQQLENGTVDNNGLQGIEQRIQAWAPDASESHLSSTFSRLEILSMRTQARMYRIAGLLLVHRLRHPLLGHEDTTATSLATEILDARHQFFVEAGRNAKLQNIVFPLLLALLEVRVPLEGLWEGLTWLQTRPACVDRLFNFVKYTWDQKALGFGGSLIELLEKGPKFVPLP